MSLPRHLFFVILLVQACILTGCLGPRALHHSRTKYNDAIQRSADEQLLLNLVRLRYRDTPSFIELSSLSTQFAFGGRASASGSVIERSTTADSLGLGASWDASERPTVTYDPLRGQEFVKRLVSPVDEETIILLIRSGWSIDRVLRITTQELNGVENVRRASGPTPDTIATHEYGNFRKAVLALRQLQISRETTIGYEDKQKAISGPVDPALLDASDIIDAAQEGWRIEPRQERVSIALSKLQPGSTAALSYRDESLLRDYQRQIELEKTQKPFRVTYDPKERKRPFRIVSGELGDLRLLAYEDFFRTRNLNPDLFVVPCIVEYPDEYLITGPTQSLILSWKQNANDRAVIETQLGALPASPSFEAGRYALDIEPRSLMGTLYYLSHAIDVPESHLTKGLVTSTFDEAGNWFDWSQLTGDLLTVHCSAKKPDCAAIAVEYRDHWYYIDDRDLDSKATFTLLMQLFELQAGGGAAGSKPVLTLPVGL
jgi:hypothetical protein